MKKGFSVPHFTEIHIKKSQGEKLTDLELMILLEKSGTAAQALFDMGPVFYLARQACIALHTENYEYAVRRGLLKQSNRLKGFDLPRIRAWIKRHINKMIKDEGK